MPKKRRKKKSKTNKSGSERCDFCNKRISGLPHRCKFCGEKHCYNHLVPEEHNCTGLSKGKLLAGNTGAPNFYKQKEKYKEKKSKSKYFSSSPEFILSKPKPRSKVYEEGPPYVSSKRNKNKKKQKLDIPFKKIFWIIILAVLIYLVYTNWGTLSSYFTQEEPIDSFSLDSITEEVFGYINEYRTTAGSPDLIYSQSLYEWVKATAENKDTNPESYEKISQFKELIDNGLDTKGITNSYYGTYFIKGEGPEKFLEEFNKNYIGRNLIRDKKYNRGAIYCSLDHCVLFVFYSSQPLSSIEKIVPVEEAAEEAPVEEEKTSYLSDAWDYVSNLGEELSKPSESEIDIYETNPKEVNLQGVGGFTVYQGLNDHLSGLDRSIGYYYDEPTTKDFILKDIDNKVQKRYLDPLVDKIKAKSNDPNQQAKIAISLVQSIPYDWDGLYGIPEGRMPYEVLYDKTGVCGEKSGLLTYLLRELGFGVAIFEYEAENHRAVGIRCNNGNYNSQYCFIEATDHYPIGKIPSNYVGGADIRNANPEIIIISDGITYS
jgi:hypothetical protein